MWSKVISDIDAAQTAKSHRLNDALNSYIVEPQESTIWIATDNGLPKVFAHHAAQCQKSLQKLPDLKENEVTDWLRADFIQCMKDEFPVAIATAQTPESATALGLPEDLAPYFKQCQSENGITPGDRTGVNEEKAWLAINCIRNNQFIKDDLVPVSLTLGGLALAGIGYKLGKGRRYY